MVPVLNEAHVLEKSIRTLECFFRAHIALDWRLVIAENGSTDGTADIGDRLAAELPRVECLRIGQRGRGRALRLAWSRPGADILCYTLAKAPKGTGEFPSTATPWAARTTSSSRSGHELA